MLKRFLPLMALLLPLAACMTLEGVQEEAERIQLETQEAIDAINVEYVAGTITAEERQERVAEATKRAQEDIAAIPEEARRLAELEAESLKQRGGEFSLTLLQLLLLGLGIPVAGGAAHVGIQALRKKKD